MITENEKHTIKDWCYILRLRLLDESYYDDKTLYTIDDFERIVPRNIQLDRYS